LEASLGLLVLLDEVSTAPAIKKGGRKDLKRYNKISSKIYQKVIEKSDT